MDNDAAMLVTGGDDHKEFMQQWLDTNESTSVDFARTCAGERGVDREEGFASRFYSTCLRGFQQLCRQEQKGYAHGSRSYLLKEELDKLYMWGESFGPGELDKTLGESEEIRDNVLDLLVNLGELVICELRASSTVARAGQFHELESFIEQAKLIMSDVDGQVDLDTLASDARCLNRDDYSDDDVHDFYEEVAFTIECLIELGPSLEQNLASTGRSAPSTSKSSFDLFYLSGPAGFYVSLVRDKFKQASKELVERLGEANWQRHLKVRNIMEDPENNPAKGQETARSVFQPDTTFHDSGIGTSVPARTQYAPSHTSFRTSNTEGGLRSLRVPPTPLEATDGKSFRCYLCGDMLSTVRTRTQWKMHVFSDLMPYICTFDGCQHKLRCFPSRSAWANHEFQEHRFDRYWACPECPRKSCSTLDWELHLSDVHNQKFSGLNLVSARNMAYRISPKRAEEAECPLCRVVLGKPRHAFVKHVCRHMEDIALMALPSNAEEDSDIGSISTNPNSNENNDTSKDLHIDEEYTIKCICGFEDDDGNTVYCEQCDTWQHTECYYLDENGIVPNMDVLSSIDHFCAECRPRSLDPRGAIERQASRRAEIGPHSLMLQPYEQHSNALPESPTARIVSTSDTNDGLIRESPQVEGDFVNAQRSISPDYLPPRESPPTPELTSRSKRRERRAVTPIPQAASSQPTTVARTKRDWPESVRLYVQRAFAAQNHVPFVGHEEMEMKLKQVISDSAESNTLTNIDWANIPLPQEMILAERQRSGLKHPDLASKAGEEPLMEEYDESTDKNEVESENGSDSTELLRTAEPGLEWGLSSKDHFYGPRSNESTEAPHLKDLNPIDPFVEQAGMPVDGEPQVLGPQELVKEAERRRIGRRRLTLSEMAEISRKRRLGVCNHCRRLKRRCPHVHPDYSREWLEAMNALPSLPDVNYYPSDSYQTTKSTSEATDNPNEPRDIYGPVDLSSKDDNESFDWLPPLTEPLQYVGERPSPFNFLTNKEQPSTFNFNISDVSEAERGSR